MNNRLPFRPVIGTSEQILKQIPQPGYVWFATDTKKIYYSDDNSFLSMGGNTGIYYGKKQLTHDEQYGDLSIFNFLPSDIDGEVLPSVNDLILNIPDGGFYRVLQINDNNISTQRLTMSGSGGGGSGDNSNEGSLEIKYVDTTDGKFSIMNGEEFYIEFDIVAKDSAGDLVFNDGDATWSINGKTYSQKVSNGRNRFRVDEYLDVSKETNSVILVVSMFTGGSKPTVISKTWGIKVINLSLEWSWNYSEEEYKNQDTFTLQFIPYCGINCTAHIIFDNKREEGYYYTESISTTNSGRTYTTKSLMTSLPYGVHSCEIYLEAIVNGEIKQTKPIKHEITFIKDGSSTLLTIPFYSSEVQQYDTINIPFLAYDPDSEYCNISFYVNDQRISGDSFDRDLHYWPYTAANFGSLKLSIRADNGDSSKDIELVVNKLDLGVEEVPGAKFSLKATNFSNNEEVRQWNSNGITLSFSDNFDWKKGGLQFEAMPDGSIEKFIRVRQGTRMWINYKLFENFVTGTAGGKNFKFCFKATNCYDYEAQVMDCMSYRYEPITLTTNEYSTYKYYIYDDVNNKYVLAKNDYQEDAEYFEKISNDMGLIFDAQQAKFVTSAYPNFATQYCENSYVEVETEIWPKVNDKVISDNATIYGDRFLMIWVDGVPAGVKPYSTSMALTQVNPQVIEIGSDLCDVLVYCAKVYERKLSFDEHLDNFIMDAPSSVKMIERFRRNDIMDNNNEISYEKLVKANPGCHAYLYDIPEMTTTKDDKIDGCTYYELIDGYDTIDNPYIRAEKVRTYVQGTSSAAYGVAAFNLRSDFTKKGKIYNAAGEEMVGWQRTPDDLPIDIACTKVNVASCENANNVVNQEWYNKFQPYWDAHRRKGYVVDAEGNALYNPCRDTMGFHSGVIFIRDHNTETNYLNENGEPKTSLALEANVFFDDANYMRAPFFKMYSIGNMGNDKKNINVFHDITNPRAACVEIADNQNAEHWMTIVNEDAFEEKVVGYDDDGKEITEGPFYEFRYGVVENKNMENNEQGVTEESQRADFMRFVSWMAHNDPHPYDAELHPFGYTGNKLVDEDGNDAPVTFSEDFVFQGFDPPGYEGKPNPTGISLKGQKITKYKKTYTHDTKEYRIAKMLYECEDYLVMDSVVFHYLYILRHTMVDNVAKNTFWSTEDGLHWDLTKDYDNDTSDGNDNTGNLTYTYGLEYGDLNSDGKDVFNATPSVWIAFIHELYDAQQYLYNELEKKGAWNPQHYLAEFKKHQDIIPERCWLADYQRKYLRPRQLGLDQQTYLDRLEGGRKTHQRTQFETYQGFYINSKYVASTDFSDSGGLEFRLNKNPAESWDPNNILPISFYIDCYGTIHLGGQKKTSGRLKRKQVWNAPVGQMVEAPSDATCFVYGANMIQSMSGFDKLYPGYAKLNGASKLLSIELGSGAEDYYNARLKEVGAGSNTMLQKLQMRNSGSDTFAPLTLDRASRLTELLLSGSAVKELSLADGASTEILELNALKILTLKNLLDLKTIRMDDGIYNSIEELYISNCPKLDTYTYDFAKRPQLKRYHLNDFHWAIKSTGEDYNLANDFALSANGAVEGILAVDNLMDSNTVPKDGTSPATALVGTITIDVPCTIDEYDLYEKYIKKYPNLLITYGENVGEGLSKAVEITFSDFYTNNLHYRVLSPGVLPSEQDRSSVAKLISDNGPTGIAIKTPTKEDTVSKTYTFTGYWIERSTGKKYYNPIDFDDNHIHEENVISFADVYPTENMNFYPEYEEKTKEYAVKFYDWNGNIIKQEKMENGKIILVDEWMVPYEQKYDGPIKNYYYRDSSQLPLAERWSFQGWSVTRYGDKPVKNPEYVDLNNLKVTETVLLYSHFITENCFEVASKQEYFTKIGNAIIINEHYKDLLKGKITIPTTLMGTTITSIGTKGFADNKNITHIFFEKDCKIKTIGESAFSNCSNLIYFNFANSIEEIKKEAFVQVPLEPIGGEYSFGSNIKVIGDRAFNQALKIPSSGDLTIKISGTIETLASMAISNLKGDSQSSTTSIHIIIGDAKNYSPLSLMTGTANSGDQIAAIRLNGYNNIKSIDFYSSQYENWEDKIDSSSSYSVYKRLSNAIPAECAWKLYSKNGTVDDGIG